MRIPWLNIWRDQHLKALIEESKKQMKKEEPKLAVKGESKVAVKVEPKMAAKVDPKVAVKVKDTVITTEMLDKSPKFQKMQNAFCKSTSYYVQKGKNLLREFAHDDDELIGFSNYFIIFSLPEHCSVRFP